MTLGPQLSVALQNTEAPTLVQHGHEHNGLNYPLTVSALLMRLPLPRNPKIIYLKLLLKWPPAYKDFQIGGTLLAQKRLRISKSATHSRPRLLMRLASLLKKR